jgi:hypothetical protein
LIAHRAMLDVSGELAQGRGVLQVIDPGHDAAARSAAGGPRSKIAIRAFGGPKGGRTGGNRPGPSGTRKRCDLVKRD